MDNSPLPTPPEPQQVNFVQAEKKRGFPWAGFLALLFVVVLIITIFSPSAAVSNVMGWVMIATGFVTAAGVFNTIINSVQRRGPITKFFAVFVSIFLAIIIVIVSLIAGFIGSVRNTPIEGD